MKVLEKAAKRKKDKYLEACRERRRDFIPVDGLAGKEARAAEKRLASLLASMQMGPSLQRDGVLRQDLDVHIHRAINFYASAWLSVLDLEAQGPRRQRRSPCLCHLSEVVGGQISAHLPKAA